jgi:enoyl-CoA hydratase/carnithine racemase
MTEQIKVTQDGAVLEIVFARPDKKNALSNAMYGAATAALTAAQKNPAIRVVLFAAEGDRILARMDEESAVFAQRLQTDEAREAFKAFAERRQPDFMKLAS